MANGIKLKKKHDRLRSWYYFELGLGVTLLFTYLLAILILYIISLQTTVNFDVIFYYMFGGGALLLIAVLIFFPHRARKYQKKLLLKTFEQLNIDGVKLFPFFLKAKPSMVLELLSEAGIIVNSKPLNQSSYEFLGRLINVLHFREEGKSFSIIHIPRRENPYYLQINNGKFSEPKKFKGIEINQLYYVSPHNLTYFATSGPPNVNIYLRKNLETRFVKIVEKFPLTYQYVVTYTDEFLLLKPWNGILPLRLSAKYSAEYYDRIYNNLLCLQAIMAIMLEKGN